MRSEAGYSLAEMLTVVAIIGVLSLVMVPNFIGYYQSNKMKTSMRDLTTDLRTVRQLAITQGKQAALVYDTGNGQRSYNYYLGDKAFGSTTWRPQTGRGALRPTRFLDDIAFFPNDTGSPKTTQTFAQDLLNCDPTQAWAPNCATGVGLGGTANADSTYDVVFYPDGRVQLPANSTAGTITIQTTLTKLPKSKYTITISPSGRVIAN